MMASLIPGAAAQVGAGRSAMRSRRLAWRSLLAAGTCALPAGAHAQSAETLLIAPSVPQGFDRGRNVSVSERARPDYDAIGIRLGGFNAFPRLDVGAGGTSNLYLTSDGEDTKAFVYARPSFRIASDWSRHELDFTGGGQLLRYIGAARRKEDAWNAGTLGKLELGSFTTVTAEAQIASQFETPFSGEVSSSLAVLSRYLRGFVSLRGQYTAGQGRALLAVDHTGFSFSKINLGDNLFVDQSNRDRGITRITGQVEYAFTPSVSLYAQGAVGLTRYDDPLAPGIPNRDSDGYRVIGGVNFDIAGRARGTLGVGYIRRNYLSGRYRDVDGFSVEGRIEYFPTELTTFTLGVRRVIEDSSISTSDSFFDNRISLRVDHELRQNLLLNLTAEVARQDYIGSDQRADVYRFSGGANYLLSRTLRLNAGVSYTGRSTTGGGLGSKFDEVRGQAGITLQI